MGLFSKLFGGSKADTKQSDLSPGRLSLAFPSNWRPGTSARSASGHMEFFGSDGSSMKFAIGPISPEPTVMEQIGNLERIALRHGHAVLSTGDIDVAGRKHATMTCNVPNLGVLKHYSLIMDGTEYLVTAKGNIQLCDSIVKTFRAT